MKSVYVTGGSRQGGGKQAGPAIYEMNNRCEGRSVRDLPRLVTAGVAITWQAGRRELIIMTVLKGLSGVGVAAEVIVGRRVLEAAGGGAWPRAWVVERRYRVVGRHSADRVSLGVAFACRWASVP